LIFHITSAAGSRELSNVLVFSSSAATVPHDECKTEAGGIGQVDNGDRGRKRERLMMLTKKATGVIKTGNTAMGALAVGALALGAGAIGALAVGALAIGRLRILEARVEKLSIGTLTVEHLNVRSRD
jgi:hypothetical protein